MKKQTSLRWDIHYKSLDFIAALASITVLQRNSITRILLQLKIARSDMCNCVVMAAEAGVMGGIEIELCEKHIYTHLARVLCGERFNSW